MKIIETIRRKSVLGSVAALTVAGVALSIPIAAPKAAPAKSTPSTPAQRVTNALTRVLNERVSSPGGKRQMVVRPTARAAQGYFSEIYIAAQPAKVKKLRFRQLILHAKNVRVDVPYLLRVGKIRTLGANTTLRAVVTEDDLTNMLAQGKHSAAMGLKVKFLGDRIRVAGNWKWSWFSGPVVGVGRLHIVPGNKVNFEILSLKLNGAEVPQFVKNKFSENLNPIIDYDDMPFQPRFRTLKMNGPVATVTS